MDNMKTTVKCLTHFCVLETGLTRVTVVDESTMLTFDVYSGADAGTHQNVISCNRLHASRFDDAVTPKFNRRL